MSDASTTAPADNINNNEPKRVVLRLCTLGKAPPQLPLKQEYDILGVETTLVVTPSTTIYSASSFDVKDSAMYNKISYTKTMESEATASTMPSVSGSKCKYLSDNKDDMLRRMGIVPLNERREPSKTARNCCNLPVRECRDAYATLSNLSSKVESMLCGSMNYSSRNKGDKRDDTPLFDADDEEDDEYSADSASRPPLLVGASSESTFDWDDSVMTIETGDTSAHDVVDTVKVKILNGDESLRKILDKSKGTSLKMIKEDRNKPLRGVAYLERFSKLEINEESVLHESLKESKKDGKNEDNDLSLSRSESNENIDEDVVGLVSSSCVQPVENGNNMSNTGNDQRLTTATPYHFNLDESPHWSSCSDDNRDASNTFGVGATATISKDCNSFSTSGTSPDLEAEEGNTYACGKLDESREPFSNTCSATSSGSVVVTPSASAEVLPDSTHERKSLKRGTRRE